MSDLLLKSFLTFLTVAVTAASVQNTVLVKGFGISRIIRFPKENSDIRQMAVLVFLAIEISSLLDFLSNYYLFDRPVPEQWRGVAVVVYSIITYYIILILSRMMLLKREAEKTEEVLPTVCFSYAVFGTLAVIDTSGYTLLQYLGYGAGAALGYAAALILTVEGYKITYSEKVPKAFRGLPALLLYFCGLVLAVYALSKSA